MTEIKNVYAYKALSALKKFSKEVGKEASKIKDLDEFKNIKKPLTIDECHIIIDGFMIYGRMRAVLGCEYTNEDLEGFMND